MPAALAEGRLILSGPSPCGLASVQWGTPGRLFPDAQGKDYPLVALVLAMSDGEHGIRFEARTTVRERLR
jgi:hypothetical protein